MLKELLESRNIPLLSTKEEMLDILQDQVYGYLPPKPEELKWTIEEDLVPRFCGGKASLSRVLIHGKVTGKQFSFPVYCALPLDEKKHPFFVHINFRPDVPDRYMPTEELIDNGFAVISFGYEDVSCDTGDLTDGLAGVFLENGHRKGNDPGKIMMWAWAAMRALDYALTLPCLDPDCAIVCGHSRLGKTALVTAALDERFAFAYSNESGCAGAAITRDKRGERILDSFECGFWYWYCENYRKYIGREHDLPCDQHYLLSSIAPRYVCVGSAVEDIWADSDSEMLCCLASSPAYEQLGKTGFISEDRLPVPGDVFFEGTIGYHLRSGSHYFNRDDWKRLMEFVSKKRNGEK